MLLPEPCGHYQPLLQVSPYTVRRTVYMYIRSYTPPIPSHWLSAVQALGRVVYQQAMVHFQGAHLVTVMELCSTDLHSVLHSNDFPLLPSVIKRLLHDLLKVFMPCTHTVRCSSSCFARMHLVCWGSNGCSVHVTACTTCCSYYRGLSVSELFEVPSHCVRVLFLRCDALWHSLQR
jgi:hypothetical protein